MYIACRRFSADSTHQVSAVAVGQCVCNRAFSCNTADMASTLRLRQNVFLIMHTKTYFRAAKSVCSQQAAELLLQEVIPFWMQGSCKRHARGAAEQATQRCLPAAQLKAVCMSARQSSAPCCQHRR
jgi:hypothetical protein